MNIRQPAIRIFRTSTGLPPVPTPAVICSPSRICDKLTASGKFSDIYMEER